MGMWKLGASNIPPERYWDISTLQHTTHIRHHHVWGEMSTHHKWDSKEEIFWYTQHWKTDCNTTANIHWKSGTQLWQPSSNQTSHCMVQPQATTWRCTAHEQKINHPTHIRHQYDWGEISTHHKWDSKEEILRYTQHKKDCNMTANLHWKSGTQLWQPSSIQNSHYMVQPQEKTWKCTAHKEKSIVRSLRLIILRVEKTRALKIWAHFAVDDRYWGHLISGLGTSSASTPPAPAPSIYRAHSPTTPPTLIP